MAWYAFECRARQAAQVMRNRLSRCGEVSLCYITQALQGRIGHGNETVERGFVPNWKLTLSEHTHAHIPLPIQNLIKVAWITVLFDFRPVFPLNLPCTLDTASFSWPKCGRKVHSEMTILYFFKSLNQISLTKLSSLFSRCFVFLILEIFYLTINMSINHKF